MKEIAIALLPALVHELGAAAREWLQSRRERAGVRDLPCEHGRPGGRLCGPCADRKERA